MTLQQIELLIKYIDARMDLMRATYPTQVMAARDLVKLAESSLKFAAEDQVVDAQRVQHLVDKAMNQ